MSAFIELTFPTKTVYAVYISRRTLLYFSYSFNSIQFILQQKDPASSVALLESRRPLTHENFMKRSFGGWGGWTYFTARVLLARGLSTGSFKKPKIFNIKIYVQ